MLNVGPLELVVVVAVALIVVGPERLPELARSVGRALRQLRQVQDEVRDMVAMGVDEDMRRAASDLKRTASDLTKAADMKGAARTVRAEARKTLQPSARRSSAGKPSEPVTDGPSTPDAPTAPDGSALDMTDATDVTDVTDAGAATDAVAAEAAAVVEATDAVAEPEVAGPPADRLVEDAATSPGDGDATEPA